MATTAPAARPAPQYHVSRQCGQTSLTHKVGGYSDPGLVVENIEVAHVEGSVRLVIDHVDGGDPAGHRGAEQNHLQTKYIFQESLQIKCLGSKMRLQHIDCDGIVLFMR